ncbi:hypothetical protein LTR85_001263 [Meristemomyces frigidus]|nr:hypothetical protein LTR85_001263 [Meristemomyces frigidus]
MACLGRLGFLCLAVVFHVVYILSIFDIYFTSPIVSGMAAYSVNAPKAPAKRLVLYVGDGLRADKAFQFFPDPSPQAANVSSTPELRPLAPFLRSKVLEDGTFGVSHTRVPTESRPGHVALIAGLYEDVSAVTTGWKLNPVNFDSVFNRSRHTWSWGSPDILPMFSTGAVPGRVTDDTYGSEFEDFSKDATELDYFVFDHVKQLFQDAETDADLNAKLREDKVVFFLHLLGLDTTGHAYRPYSREYLHNIKVVDQGVKEITNIMDDFYGDGETAYVFTADHGMSDWGSHGDGHPDNTRTPLIAWGAGVAKPKTVASGKAPGHEDGFSHDWHLDQVERHDVAQADIATLMAYLAGLEFPVNSVGELPLTYLSAGDEEKAKAMLVNAREILEMYRVKEEAKKATVLRYRPYKRFASVNQTIDKRLAHVEAAISNGRYEQSIKASDELIQLGLQGLRYLQTYDWLFLRALVTAGYIGWVAFAFTTAVDMYMLDGRFEASRTPASITAFSSILVGLYSLLLIQSSPITYYAYAFFPVMFWEEVFVRRRALVECKKKLFAKASPQDLMKLTLNVAMYLAILEVMVQSYYHREIYTICYLLAAAWPAVYGLNFVQSNWILCTTWVLGCTAMSIFTILPAIKVESASLIMLGGLLILIVGVLYIAMEKSLLSSIAPADEGLSSPKADGLSRAILGAQVGLVALAMSMAPLPTPEPQVKSRKVDKKPKRACSKTPTSATWPVHQYIHQFPLPLRGMILITLILWGIPVALAWALIKVFWEIPHEYLQKRRAHHRAESTTTANDTAPNDAMPKARSASTDNLLEVKRHAVQPLPVITVAREADFAKPPMQCPTVPISAIYATNRANRSLSSRSRRSSFSGVVEHEIVVFVVNYAHALLLTRSTVASLIVPFLHALQPRNHYLHRLAVIFLAFGPLFIILTISYEGLFYFAIAITLVSWVRLEHRIQEHLASPSISGRATDVTNPLEPALSAASNREKALGSGDYRSLTMSDARICLFFLYLLQSAFFSTGNIASVSSFSLDAVYRLLPVFDPFSQGALLLLKLLAPFALVSANLGILTKRLKLRGGSLFAVVMGIGDYLTLRFFWEVRDEGSWLDIGESISMFVIASMLCVFVALLEALSEVFVKGVEFRVDGLQRRKEGKASNGSLNGAMNGSKPTEKVGDVT